MPHACVTWLRGRSAPPWSWLALLRFQRASQSEVRDSIILRPSSCDWDGRDVVLLKWGLKKIRGACSGCPSKPNSRGPGAGDVSRPQRAAFRRRVTWPSETCFPFHPFPMAAGMSSYLTENARKKRAPFTQLDGWISTAGGQAGAEDRPSKCYAAFGHGPAASPFDS